MKKIAIIGGGIVGLTLANYLNTQKFAVSVFDESTGQATKASAGIISPWLSKRRNQQWYRLARDGAAFMPKLVQDFSLDKKVYEQVGTLVIRPEEKLDELITLAHERRLTAPEIGRIERYTAQQTAQAFPLLKEQAAVFIHGGARLNGAAYLQQLKEQAVAKGVIFHEERAQCTATPDGSWHVTTTNQIETFDYVALTVGPHLPALLAPLALNCRVQPQKGELIVFQTAHTHSQQWPVAMLDGEADLIPFANGQIVLGATHDKEAQWDLTPTQAAYTQLTESAHRFLQAPEQLFNGSSTMRVGTRAYTPDFAPFFGPLAKHPSLVVASGLGSSGLTTGPYIGYLLAQYFNEDIWATIDYQKPMTNYIE